MILYTWANSLASFRVRIALNLKGIKAEFRFVNLRRDGGEQFTAVYSPLNPMQAIPALLDGDRTLTQSMAIVEYLEETYLNPPLLPRDPHTRAAVRQICEVINSDIHPLGTPRVSRYLRSLGLPQEQVRAWYPHWIHEGLTRLETMVGRSAGRCCVGDTPTIADCFVVPQVYYARRLEVDLGACPTLDRIWEHLSRHPAVTEAVPEAQPDYEQ